MSRSTQIVILVILLMLNVSWLSDVFGLKEPHPLHGESTKLPMPEVSFQSIWKGDFQHGVDEYVRTNFLLRGLAIRTRNEIDYSIFSEQHARSVITGQEGYLFEENYIFAALGLDSIPTDSVMDRVDRIATLSNTSGVPFLVVLAPGKGSYFREFLPLHFLGNEGIVEDRMFDIWSRISNEKLNVLDLQSHFAEVPNVFPKNGIHWCEWVQVEAINLMSDALVKILPDSLKPARLLIDGTYTSFDMEGTDEDIENGLNLWRDLEDLETKYYETHWEEVPLASRPRILIVGDSYAWGPVNRGLLSRGYRSSEFWFYNAGVHGPSIEEKDASPQSIHGFTTREEFEEVISSFDAVVLLSTDANLPRFPFHFTVPFNE
ncbi:MAG: hypothetical protein ACKVJY_00555 [Flavobacteriales bacterium]